MFTPADLQNSAPVRRDAQKFYATHAADGKDVFLLPEILKRLDAILIDVRFVPAAQPLKWNKDYLKRLLKGKYLHVPNLGSRTAQKPAIQNLALGVKIITDLKINLLIFCACADEANCHRPLIIDELKRLGKDVKEISEWTLKEI